MMPPAFGQIAAARPACTHGTLRGSPHTEVTAWR
jgi:hypothetical protein